MRGKRLELKEPRGWFAAGEGFQEALRVLSDGAFKLFADLCLEADRESGCLASTQGELARFLGKSRRVIGTYLEELAAKGICEIRQGKNQYAPTTLRIREAYWPYQRPGAHPEWRETNIPDYVESVRRFFLSLGCSTGRFTASDVRLAQGLQEKRVPRSVIEDALLLGACRKYLAWLEGHSSEPIGSLRYFQSRIEAIEREPFPAGYRDYLGSQLQKFSRLWSQSPHNGRPKPGSAKK